MPKNDRERMIAEREEREAKINAGTHYAHWFLDEQGKLTFEIREFSIDAVREYLNLDANYRNDSTWQNLALAMLKQLKKLERTRS